MPNVFPRLPSQLRRVGTALATAALSFSPARSIAPGASSGGIQNRIYQTSFAAMTQTNDYSFSGADTSFAANPGITVYDNGTLIYGTTP